MNIYQKDLLKRLSLEREAKILDWGCGYGNEIDEFKRVGFKNVSGLEIDEKFSRMDIVIDSDSIGFLEKAQETYDVIFARESIYYIQKKDQSRLWSAFFKALKPNGHIIVITFNGALTTSQFIIQKDLDIQFALNEISLVALAQKAGFTGIETLGIKPKHRTPIGAAIGYKLSLFKRINLTLTYLSERGFDHLNPKLLTKNIVLLAQKPE